GLRGLAALMIVLHHSAFSYWMSSTFDKAWWRATSLLWTGVDLFFVLSGFLITNILLETKDSRTYFRSFYGRRFVGIFPLYYGFLAIVYIALPLFGSQLNESIRAVEPWQWTYTTNIYAALQGAMPDHNVSQSWTLAIEEQFYLCWPLLIFLIPKPRVGWTVAALFVSIPCIRALSLAAGATAFYVCTMTFCRVDGLLLGALLSVFVRGGLLERIRERPRVLRTFDWIFGGGSIAFLIVFAFLRNDQFQFDVLTWPRSGQVLGLSLVALPLGYLVFRCITPGGNRVQRFLMHRPLRELGKYSYALYVLHAPIVYWVGWHVPTPDFLLHLTPTWSFLHSVYIIAIEVVLSIAAAVFSWHLLEKHFLKLKKYFPYRKPAEPGPEFGIPSIAAERAA